MNLHSCVWSPAAIHRTILIVENVAIARDTFRLRLGDAALAQAIRPGQFVMIRPAPDGATDPLLGRPLALYDIAFDRSGKPDAFDVVYQVVGRGTAALSLRQPGEQIAVWGPLGNGFGPPPDGTAIFVAGGIGQTPFLALGRSWLGWENADRRGAAGATCPATQIGAIAASTESRAGEQASRAALTLLYGVRTAGLLAGVDDFRQAGVEVELATDDGTAGHHGFVTELLLRRLVAGERPAKVIACGPPAMLSAVAKIVATYRIPCDVSLENHMACGFGACFSCVAPIRQDDGSIDLRRVCVEGPVVPAERVDWARMAH
jgi:dihydroorotate dehydrogenase electron transfer subunit